jgi:NAD(P)-dependent dehydrogenase (short-subunit alcohol dehydrogenase family)
MAKGAIRSFDFFDRVWDPASMAGIVDGFAFLLPEDASFVTGSAPMVDRGHGAIPVRRVGVRASESLI